MSAKSYYESIENVVYLKSNIKLGCERCDERFGFDDDNMVKLINHYINQHGYRVLHVGAETSTGHDGNPWHNTVALLGV